jgi:hypothetical protein
LKKQSQFAADEIGTSAYIKRTYGKKSVSGGEENKANQSQFQARSSLDGSHRAKVGRILPSGPDRWSGPCDAVLRRKIVLAVSMLEQAKKIVIKRSLLNDRRMARGISYGFIVKKAERQYKTGR